MEAVIAWEYPTPDGFPIPPAAGGGKYDKIAAEVVAEAHAEVCDPDESVKINSRVMKGNAAQTLLDASAGADRLVAGNRGHSGFVEASLGSVGQHCICHATCPVVVIRGATTGRP